MLVNFILTNRKATRVLFVIIPFLVLWAATSVVIFWIPGVLDAIRSTEDSIPGIFWLGSIIPGILLSGYFSVRGAHYLWVWSATIYEGLEQ